MKNREALEFSLINALDWRDCTEDTEHGILPTRGFLDRLLDIMEEELEIRSMKYIELQRAGRFVYDLLNLVEDVRAKGRRR